MFATLLGIICFPVCLLLALLIKMDSRGSVFYRQERVGKDLRLFRIFKFRSMLIETEKDGVPLSDMERITPLGNFLRKSSLDEIPQILNVLKGEMSFIGPRPLLKSYIPRYSEFQLRRHEVLPGITGIAQVKGRNALSWEEKFALDVWYVDNISFKVDVMIFFLTIKTLLTRQGVNKSDQQTMEPFRGREGDEERMIP